MLEKEGLRWMYVSRTYVIVEDGFKTKRASTNQCLTRPHPSFPSLESLSPLKLCHANTTLKPLKSEVQWGEFAEPRYGTIIFYSLVQCAAALF